MPPKQFLLSLGMAIACWAKKYLHTVNSPKSIWYPLGYLKLNPLKISCIYPLHITSLLIQLHMWLFEKKDIIPFIKSRNHYEMLFHTRNATKTLMHFSLIAWLSRLSLLVKIKVGKSLFTPSSFISWNYTMNNFPILLPLECLCCIYILFWKVKWDW